MRHARNHPDLLTLRETVARSERQPGCLHLLRQFLRSGASQLTAQKLPDLRRLDAELIGQGTHTVAVTGQARFKVVELTRQDALDHLDRDWTVTDPVRLLEREGQVLLDLKRGLQAAGQQVHGRRFDQFADIDALAGAACEEPADVGKLVPRHAVELKHHRAVADLLHGRAPEVVPELGVPHQHDGEHAAAIGHHLHQSLQTDQRLAVQVVGLVHEQGHRLAAASHELLQFALALLAEGRNLRVLVWGEVMEQRGDEGGDGGCGPCPPTGSSTP